VTGEDSPDSKRPASEGDTATGGNGWATGEDDSGRRQITSIEGIPALSLDAISSVAYGPEAMLVVLASAGAGALARIEPGEDMQEGRYVQVELLPV